MESPLDEYCERIFSLLMVTNKKYRFNELHRQLGSFGAKMSKPTLIDHLQHLQGKGFIQRREEDKQNVSYKVNWKKFEDMKDDLAFKRRLELNLQNEETFKSLSLDEQITTLTSIFTIGELRYLKLYVLDILEPDKKPEHRFSYIFMHKLLDMYRLWLLDICKESKANSQKALEMIQRGIIGFEKELFGQTAEQP
jgi:hypothetical protein